MKKLENISTEHQELLLSLGQKLKQLRISQKKSYIEKAQEIGIPRNTYNKMELGKINFQFSTLLQVLQHYNISVSDFFKDLKF